MTASTSVTASRTSNEKSEGVSLIFSYTEGRMGTKTIYERASDSFIVEKSEFIGNISPVKTEEDAVRFIEEIRSANRKARHNCYAYVLRDGNISRYSDDSEPQGTAGLPILDVINKNGLTDVAIVVTRYFGGILLGKGGLTRAYSTAASIAVAAAHIMELMPAVRFNAALDYRYYDKLSYILPDFDIRLIDTAYSDNVTISAAVRAELFDDFSKKLMDITNGSAVLSEVTNIEFDFA